MLNGFDVSSQRTDLELITAPDGLAWRRLPTRPRLLGPGDPAAWDSGGVYSGAGDALVFGDRCGLYYGGTMQRHDGHDTVKTPPGIGLATFAQGGFSANCLWTAGPLLPRLTSRSSAGRPLRKCH